MTVLVAYDGKEHTKKAVDYAVKYAKAFGERLYVMSVIPSKKHMDEVDDIKEKLESIKSSAESEGVETITIIEAGNPSETLLSSVKRFECGTIVVGRSDNKTGLDRVVLGSVSNYVVNNASCTVIVVQ